METMIISVSEVELATVLWFNSQKRFGFAKDQMGREIFFHFNDGRFVEVEAKKLVFGKATRSFNIKGVVPSIPLADPRAGDVILFVRFAGSKGRPKASPWVYDDDYLTMKMTLEEDSHRGDKVFEQEEENFLEVKLPGGRNGVLVPDYHEVNLGDTCCGLKTYE
jgi:hypothetical protein